MLHYEDNGFWRGEWTLESEQRLVVSMKDAAYQRHLNARLEAQGHSTLSFIQALDTLARDEASAILDTRRSVATGLRADLAYWQHVADAEVSVRVLPQLGPH